MKLVAEEGNVGVSWQRRLSSRKAKNMMA